MNVQKIRLDVCKSTIINKPVRIGQGDSGGTTIEAKIYDNGAAMDLTGMAARFEMRLPGSTMYVRDPNCIVSGNTITYVMDEEHAAAIHGTTDEAYFDVLVDEEVITSTNRFTIDVLQSAHDGAVPAEPWDNAVDELIERGNNSVFSSATASVDDNVGTPSVDVTLGDPEPGGRNVGFAFHNLKGEPGADGADGADGVDGADGADGADGVSCTHSWNGSVLTVTSASGTSSADLKGPQGQQGPAGTVTPITTAQIDTVVGDGTVTSDNALTGTGLTSLWGKLKAKFAALVNGAVAIAQGGTGATTASGARTNLDVPSTADVNNLEASVAPVESVTATSNHAVGDYFMLGNVLMRATAAIAAGETITISNATPATVQAQIDALQSAINNYGMLRTATYTISSIATNSAGYADLISALGAAYPQSDFTGYVMITLESWNTMSPTACAFTTAGRYLLANPNTTITGLVVRLWKRPS